MFDRIRRHPNITAAVIYVIIFAAGYFMLFSDSEYLFSKESDIFTFSYPILIDLRDFYTGLFSGEASVINFSRLFGMDSILSGGFLGNPLYFPVVFFKGDSLLYFYKFFFLTLLFLGGAAFIYMCSYFGKSPVTAALISPLYVFCPFTLYFGIWFFCFTPNFVSFPLMITGMEKVFRKQGSSMLLVTSVLTCICCGMYFFVYNVVLTVIYAFVRVIFMEGDSFWKRLLTFGTKGGICVIIGFMIAGILMLPQMAGVLLSGRVASANNDILTKMTQFRSQDFMDLFCSNYCYVSIGFMQCALVMLFLLFRRSDKVMKILFILGAAGICIPIMSAALNGFTYIEHRWMFGFTLLIAFMSLCLIYDLKSFSKTERIFGSAVLAVMIPGVYPVSIIAALVIVALANIPVVYSFLDKKIDETDKKHSNIFELIIIAVSAVFLILEIFTGDNDAAVYKAIIYLLMIICVTTIGRGVRVYHYPLAIISAFMGVLLLKGYNAPKLESIEGEMEVYIPLTQIRDIALETEEQPVRFENSSDAVNRNMSGNLGIDSNSAMFSILPGRYMNMIEKSCFDLNTFSAVLCVSGFGGRLPFMTVFGIDYIQSCSELIETDGENKNEIKKMISSEDVLPFGFEKYSEYIADGAEYTVYKNNYALPFGFTCKKIICESERSKLNGADYGISMLYGAAVEDGLADDIPLEMISPESKKIGFTISEGREYLGLNEDEYITYELKLDEAVTDCEIYLNLLGVPHDDLYSIFKATVDSGASTLGEFYSVVSHNDYKWAVMLDNYTLKLKNVRGEPVSTISIISSMEIEDFEVTVLPEAEFVSCFEELNEYTMENVSFGSDTVSGDISVPDDRMLVMSLQYDESWTAYDNGEKITTYPVNECMTGIMLTAGDHSITLKYKNKFLYYGAVLSAVGIAAAIIMLWLEKKEAVKW